MSYLIRGLMGISMGIPLLCTASYALADNAAEIAELKERIKDLEDQQAKEAEEKKAASEFQLPDWAKSIEFHGFLSAAYTWNFNDPASRTNQLRVFDFKHNQFRVDDVELSVLRAAKNPGDVGFRVDLDVGSNIPRVVHSAGLFDDSCTSANPGPFALVPCGESIDLRQAFVSYNVPVGNGLTVDFGKYITHFGLEVIEGWPGFNDNYSRSFDFGFAIPFTHTGIRATYPVNEQLSVMGIVANGWDRVDDNNDGKGFGAQIAYLPMKEVSLYFNYLGSPEQDNNDDDWRHLFGVVWVTKPLPGVLPDLTFSGGYDYGTEANVALNGGNAQWHAVEGVLRYDLTPWFYVATRGEWFDDSDGARTGTNQQLWAVTLTPTFKVTDNFVIRPEFRYDHSNAMVFKDDDGDLTKHSQVTGAVNAIFSF